MNVVTASEAKNHLLDLLRGAQERGEAVQITRNGRPAGVLVSAEEWESLLETVRILSDPAAMRKIRRARRERKAGRYLTHEEVWGKDALSASLSSRRRKGSPKASGNRATKGPARSRAARRRSTDR